MRIRNNSYKHVFDGVCVQTERREVGRVLPTDNEGGGVTLLSLQLYIFFGANAKFYGNNFSTIFLNLTKNFVTQSFA